MAASSGAPRLVRLDHLLDAWSEPSCKAKTDGRYNTNSLAFDDKRAQIASTVMNAAGIHVDRKRDGRANPSDMDQQDWDAMEIVTNSHKTHMTRAEIEVHEVCWSPPTTFDGLRVHLHPNSLWSVSIQNEISGERASAERRDARGLKLTEIATQDVLDILVQDQKPDGERQGTPKAMPATVLNIFIDIMIDEWNKDFPVIAERAVHVLLTNKHLARVQVRIRTTLYNLVHSHLCTSMSNMDRSSF